MSDMMTARLAAALTIAGEPVRRRHFDDPRRLAELAPLLEDCVGERLYHWLKVMSFNQASEWKQACSDIFRVIDIPEYLKEHAQYDLSVVFAVLMREILTRLADRCDHLSGEPNSPERLALLTYLRVGGPDQCCDLLEAGARLDRGQSLDPMGWEREMLTLFAGFDEAEMEAWRTSAAQPYDKIHHPSLKEVLMDYEGLEPA